MSPKLVVATKQKSPVPSVAKARRKAFFSKLFMRLIGCLGLLATTSLLVQGIPLLFIFLGGMMGIPADANINTMDTMIWLLTCVTMMMFVLYVSIAWLKFLWNRFILKATPFHRPSK